MKPAVVAGIVSKGLGLGRQLGFPTANIALDPGFPPPPNGVYRVEASWKNEKWPAVCSVGVRPTLGVGNTVLVEVYIPGFSGDLYGRRLKVRFLEKIREEMKFESLDALKEQIRKDVAGLRPQKKPRAS